MKNTFIAAMALSLAGLSADAAIVENGSFEDIGSGTFNGSGWNYFDSIPHWYTDPGEKIEVQSGPTVPQIDAYEGENYAELDSTKNSSLNQDVFLDIGSYVLSFFYSPRVNEAPPATTNDMTYQIAGTVGGVLGAPNSDYPYSAWTRVVHFFEVGTAGTYALQFDASGFSNSYGAFIDDVSIVTTDEFLNEVPLPASGLLLIGALAGVGFARKRKTS